MGGCDGIPASAWQKLEGAHWPRLTGVDFDRRPGFWALLGVFVDALEMVVGVRGGCGSGAKFCSVRLVDFQRFRKKRMV